MSGFVFVSSNCCVCIYWRYQRPLAGVTKVGVGGCCERADVEMRRQHFSSERVRAKVRSQVLRFSLLRAATDSPLCLPQLVQACRQAEPFLKVHICRLQNSNSAASSVTLRIQIKSKIFVGRFDLAPWNFQCGILTLEFRALSPKPATANLNPKKTQTQFEKKKKKPSCGACERITTKR